MSHPRVNIVDLTLTRYGLVLDCALILPSDIRARFVKRLEMNVIVQYVMTQVLKTACLLFCEMLASIPSSSCY